MLVIIGETLCQLNGMNKLKRFPWTKFESSLKMMRLLLLLSVGIVNIMQAMYYNEHIKNNIS